MTRETSSTYPLMPGNGRDISRPYARSAMRFVIVTLLVMLVACSPEPTGSVTQPPPVTSASTTSGVPTSTQRPLRTPTTAPATAIPATQVVPQIGVTQLADGLTRFIFPQGWGAGRGFWQVFFTAPTGSRDATTYNGGIDLALAQAIAVTTRTLDIAAFEFNNPLITTAVLDARRRGVQVRVVTDSEHGYEDSASTLRQLEAAGIPIVQDNRSAFMHNKFMIFDGLTVLTGSWNFTINDTYRNNNNALFVRSPRMVAVYQAEFDEMFTSRIFGPRGAVTTGGSFNVEGVPIEVYFSPEDAVLDRIIRAIGSARRSIKFMAFSFTEDSIGDALLDKMSRTTNVSLQGIFERTGSETRFSELTRLFCANLNVLQDGNPFTLHHKVFIIDSRIVLTGSFNFSANATTSNDENLIVIEDPILAGLYVEEFDRRWAEARVPDGLSCS